MKRIPAYLLIAALLSASIYFTSGCGDKSVDSGNNDLGILRTDENGNILGGDYTDWCLRHAVDTFTHVSSPRITYSLNNNIALLNWRTDKEYHLYGFYVQRALTTDSNYSLIGFVPGTGTTNDSVSYTFTDTLQNGHPQYRYRLKVTDIYGNFSCAYFGIIQIVNPVTSPSFGPAYPNPTSGIIKINFSIMKPDTISLYYLDTFDTLFFINNEVKNAGCYSIDIGNTYNLHKTQKRLYLKSRTIVTADSCSLYGDIEYN